MHIAFVLRVQVLHGVQCRRCLKCSSNVEIMKHAGSVQCSECLPLVTAITFTNILVFGLGLDLCLSNSHTIFLLISWFRSLNIRIDFILSSLQIHHLNFWTNVSLYGAKMGVWCEGTWYLIKFSHEDENLQTSPLPPHSYLLVVGPVKVRNPC